MSLSRLVAGTLLLVAVAAASTMSSVQAAGDPERAGEHQAEAWAPDRLRVGLSTAHLDVTHRDRVVTATARIADSRRVDTVQMVLDSTRSPHDLSQEYPWQYVDDQADLVRGRPGDGLWSLRIVVPEDAAPGSYRLRVSVTPRRGKTFALTTARRLQVTSEEPDEAPPTLVRMRNPAPGQEVERDGWFRSTVELVDTGTGVDLVWFCYATEVPVPGTTRTCSRGRLVSGTAQEGVWRAKFDSRGVPLGPAELDVTAYDRTRQVETWWGPAQVEATGGSATPIPGGYGGFTLVR